MISAYLQRKAPPFRPVPGGAFSLCLVCYRNFSPARRKAAFSFVCPGMEGGGIFEPIHITRVDGTAIVLRP
jgi:hypothetical protein